MLSPVVLAEKTMNEYLLIEVIAMCMDAFVEKTQQLQSLGRNAVETYLREVRKNQSVTDIRTTDTHVIIETDMFIGKHERTNSNTDSAVQAAEKGTYRVKHDEITLTFTSRTLPDAI